MSTRPLHLPNVEPTPPSTKQWFCSEAFEESLGELAAAGTLFDRNDKEPIGSNSPTSMGLLLKWGFMACGAAAYYFTVSPENQSVAMLAVFTITASVIFSAGHSAFKIAHNNSHNDHLDAYAQPLKNYLMQNFLPSERSAIYSALTKPYQTDSSKNNNKTKEHRQMYLLGKALFQSDVDIPKMLGTDKVIDPQPPSTFSRLVFRCSLLLERFNRTSEPVPNRSNVAQHPTPSKVPFALRYRTALHEVLSELTSQMPSLTAKFEYQELTQYLNDALSNSTTHSVSQSDSSVPALTNSLAQVVGTLQDEPLAATAPTRKAKRL